MAKGNRRGDTKVCVAIHFSPEMFERLERERAAKGVTFTSYVTDIIRCGLMCLDESDGLEPDQILEEPILHRVPYEATDSSS